MNRMRGVFIVFGIAGLCLFGAVGCGKTASRIQTQDYVVTLYFVPPPLRLGEQQLACRIQDKNYLILDTMPAMEIKSRAENVWHAVPLKRGPGKDWRGWHAFSRQGAYQARVLVADAKGLTQCAEFSFAAQADKKPAH